MPPKRVLIRRHLPLITPRIAFEIQPMPAPPPLTLRMNLAERIRRRAIIDQDPNPQIHAPPVAVLPKPTSNKGVRPGPSENKKIVPTDDNEGTITDGSESDLTDLDDVVDPEDTGTSQHAVQRTGKIPKPRGEAGRPGSGGFNLEESLGWSKDYFASVQVFLTQVKSIFVILMHLQKRTYDLAIPMLDDSKSYNKQPSYKLDRICKKVNVILSLTKLSPYMIISA